MGEVWEEFKKKKEATEPPYDELADENDELDWSWDELTGGERTELPDEDIEGFVLFAGVPEDKIEEHKKALEELGGKE